MSIIVQDSKVHSPVAAVPPLVDERLPNGARLLVAAPGGPSRRGPAAIQLWIAAGTAVEGPEEHGCAHLLEHMLFKPCPLDGLRARLAAVGVRRKEPALDLAGSIEGLGGDINAFTSHDETVFHVAAPAGRAPEAAALLAAAVLFPSFDAATLAHEREVVIEEIKQYDDDPGQRAVQSALARVYGRHGYARPVLGLVREVRGHTARRLAAYHRRAYAGERVTLVVVGEVDVAAIRRVARGLVGAAPRARPYPAGGTPAPRPGAQVRLAQVQEAYVVLAWPSPGAGAADAAAIDAASVVLGHGEASRLVSETRRKDQVVADIQASCDTLRSGGALLVTARTRAEQAAAAVRAGLVQVQRLTSEPIAAEELGRARAILESDLVYRRETVQGVANALGGCATMFGDLAREREYYAALASLTPASIQEACVRWLARGSACVCVELPRAAGEAAAKSLRTEVAAMLTPPRAAAAKKPAAKKVRSSAAARVRRGRDGVYAGRLPGGLRLLVRVERSVPVAAGWLVWSGGQISEPAPLAGAASVMAALLTRGNAQLSGDALSREIDGMAAGLDGFAGRNSLGLHFECMTRHLPAVLGHAFASASSPRFSPRELAEERRVALQDLAAEDDDPGQVAIREMCRMLHAEHPLSRAIRGTKPGLKALSSPRLHELWRRDYPLGRAVLALAGDVDVEAVVAQVKEALREAGARGSRAAERKPEKFVAPPGQPHTTEVLQDREQAHIALGYRGLCLGDAREPALDVLSAVLGGQTGRLFVALRETEGLVYEVSMSSVEARDNGHVAVHASTGQDKLPRALAAIEAQLARIVREAPAAAEVERAKAWLIGQFEIGQQRRSRMASLLALSEAHGLPRSRAFDYPQRVEAIGPAEVWRLARALLRPDRQVRALVRAPDRKTRAKKSG